MLFPHYQMSVKTCSFTGVNANATFSSLSEQQICSPSPKSSTGHKNLSYKTVFLKMLQKSSTSCSSSCKILSLMHIPKLCLEHSKAITLPAASSPFPHLNSSTILSPNLVKLVLFYLQISE